MDYRQTLHLPKTSFPMKANLTKREQDPQGMGSQAIYHQLSERSKARTKYLLHDGPPYANGHIHIGTALNKILKDFIVKSKFMGGFDSHYVPGWDCHGLPVEHEVEKSLGPKKAELSVVEIRRRCRDYAAKFIDIQREEFKRLGVFGEWENPYLTMSYDYQATIVREFGKFLLKGSVYKGKKPVHWCPTCKTALAEAEVKYEDHRSPSVYVKFRMVSDVGGRFPNPKHLPVWVVIWTTTPWTLSANLAIALHPDFIYVAVELKNEIYIMAEALLEEVMKKIKILDYRILEKFRGAALEGLKCHHPFLDRDSLLILAPYITLDAGTGCVHTAPAMGKRTTRAVSSMD
jgi:isoleucyl-tRNA synthetase